MIKTERLTIRYIAPKDWESLMDIWSDFSQSEYAKYDVPHSLEATVAQNAAAEWAELSAGKEHMFFAVCRGGTMIGYVDFHQNLAGYACGYCFHSKYHGRGYARESLQALIQWVSNGRHMSITAGTALNNLPSVRLLDALGFVRIREEKVSFYKDENGNDIYFDGGVFALKI